MKYKFILILAVLTAVSLLGCKGGSGSSKEELNFDRNTSYALGLNVGTALKTDLNDAGFHLDIDEMIKGMKDALLEKSPRFDIDHAREIVGKNIEIIREKRIEEARQAEITFLAESARTPGIIITPSGLQYEVISEGRGPKWTEDKIAVAHYTGQLADGKVFDSSFTRGTPIEFGSDSMIEGWVEGLQMMSVGSKYRFVIPSELAYGEVGITNFMGEEIIAPYAALVFEVELMEIKGR